MSPVRADRDERRSPLSRERVLQAAIRLADEGGIEALTMRKLARELGVEAMSLYNHVADKEDILNGLCEVVMSEFRFPEDDPDWEVVARRGANAWRQLLKAHPNVIQLFAERHKPMVSVDALRPMEFALATLRRTGLSERDAAQAFQVMGGYIMGFVMLEVGRMFAPDERSMTREQVAQMLPADDLPNMVDLMPYLDDCDPDEQFEFGLDLLLEGLKVKVGRGAA